MIILRQRAYSRIDVNAEGRGGALMGGMAGFLPGTLIGLRSDNPAGALVGGVAGSIGGAILGRAIARSKAKTTIRKQLEQQTKAIPKKVSAGINKGSSKADELRRVISDIYSDPRNKDFDDIEYNDIQSLGDPIGKFVYPLKDGSVPVALLNYYGKDEIVEKDGKLYLSSHGIRDKNELTKEKLLKHLDSNRKKWYDDSDEERGWVDYNSPIPRDPKNPYDKKVLDYTDYISDKIKKSNL